MKTTIFMRLHLWIFKNGRNAPNRYLFTVCSHDKHIWKGLGKPISMYSTSTFNERPHTEDGENT